MITDLGSTPCPSHPEQTATETCHRCGSYACDQCMRGEGAQAVCHRCAGEGLGLPLIPWERRDQEGTLNAAIETVKGICLTPTPFWRAHAVPEDNNSALLFALLMSLPFTIGSVMTSLLQPLLMSGMAALVGEPSIQDAMMPGMMGTAFNAGMSLVCAPVQFVVFTFILAAIYHLFLLMLGGVQRDLATTWRIICYSSAPMILTVVPFLGAFVSYIWTAIASVIGLRESHQASTGQAIGAVVLPGVICCLCFAGGFAILGAAGYLAAGAAAGNF